MSGRIGPLINWVNVLTYGAVGDGATNDTAAIQQAIDENDSVYIPEGTYIVDALLLKSNTNILGDGINNTILSQTANIPNPNVKCLFTITNSTSQTQITVTNVRISSLTLNGNVQTLGFLEPKALVIASGVSDLTIDNVKFLGFRGDGVLLGGYIFINDVEPRIERHNSNVRISNCIFDGVNNNNRNGISILDCNGLLVENCQFINTTRSDMPGAIDFEPDQDWCVVKNSLIRNCTFQNIGGNGGVVIIFPKVVSYAPPYSTTSPNTNANLLVIPTDFTIENNTFQNCTFNSPTSLKGAILHTSSYPNTTVLNILINNNTIKNLNYPTLITSGNTIIFQNNTYMNCAANVDVHAAKNITFTGNTFTATGTLGSAFTMYDMDTTNISNNMFTDCGNPGTGNAIFILNGAMNNTKINYNTFSSQPGITVYAVAKQGGVTLNGYSQFIGNNLNGLPSQYP